MRSFTSSCFVLVLLITLIMPAYASVQIRATIGEVVHVVFNFGNVTNYEEIKGVITELTIPEAVVSSLKERNLTDVKYSLESLDFDDAEKAMTASFSLSGSDIVELTFSTETMRREFRVRTDWRKFELNLTESVSLNFTRYFDVPVSLWEYENATYPTYYYNYTGTVPFDPTCYFILPKDATEVHVEEMETIVFELPPSLGESLVNSPFLILGGILVAIIVASVYRTARKSEKGGWES
ncbi:MAG: hypothetical protein ACE5L6_08730 [Candidatus Bathyarchaeia archaeon]